MAPLPTGGATPGVRRPAASDRGLLAALLFIALVVAAVGSLGAPLITPVAQSYGVSLGAAQWTLTITLLVGAVATPLLGRLGNGRHRRTTVLVTLAVAVVGSLLTIVPTGPAKFVTLLVGRGAQGFGVGLTALMMATARDHLGDRALRVIALLSVASTAGVGVGYPLAALLAQFGGVRAAYGLGLAVTSAAFLIAIRVLPQDARPADALATPNGLHVQRGSIDWAGAALLSAGLVAVLSVTSMTPMWTSNPVIPSATLGVGLTALVGWVVVERRAPRPLVDLSALRHPAVAGASLVTVAAAVGLYVLFVLITRYAQTTPAAGYGFGLTVFEAGLVVVPFSVLGFASGMVISRLQATVGPYALLAANGVVVALACVLFATTRASLIWPLLAMMILGTGVGGFWASMPRAILRVVPKTETAAAMSINQLLRSAGFAIGSAVSGLILATHTPTGTRFPTQAGYTIAAWTGAAIMGVSILLIALTGAAARKAIAIHSHT